MPYTRTSCKPNHYRVIPAIGKLPVLLVTLLTLILAGCSTNWFSPHKVSVQQGNYISQDMVDKLKPGMSKSQVRFVLGTPLVVDTFNDDEWHYIYLLKPGKGKIITSRLQVIFVEDKLVEINGDFRPSANKVNNQQQEG